MFYDGWKGAGDVLDIKKRRTEGKSAEVFCHRVSDGFALDFLAAGAKVNMIEESPSHGRAYDIMHSGINCIAVFDECSFSHAKASDMQSAHLDAIKKSNGKSTGSYGI